MGLPERPPPVAPAIPARPPRPLVHARHSAAQATTGHVPAGLRPRSHHTRLLTASVLPHSPLSPKGLGRTGAAGDAGCSGGPARAASEAQPVLKMPNPPVGQERGGGGGAGQSWETPGPRGWWLLKGSQARAAGKRAESMRTHTHLLVQPAVKTAHSVVLIRAFAMGLLQLASPTSVPEKDRPRAGDGRPLGAPDRHQAVCVPGDIDPPLSR